MKEQLVMNPKELLGNVDKYFEEHPEKLKEMVYGTKGEMDTTGLVNLFYNLATKEQDESTTEASEGMDATQG